jgi:hypothetical protein
MLLIPFSVLGLYIFFMVFFIFRKIGRHAGFTTVSTVGAICALTKIINVFNLAAFRAFLIHRILLIKMPAALWSSTKRQAGYILTHNALARPTAFINHNCNTTWSFG